MTAASGVAEGIWRTKKGPRWYNSLRFQFVALLTVALLPLGAVAVYQTDRVEEQATRSGEQALVALTGQAAKEEELVIERAFGVARFFAVVAPDFLANPERCAPDLSRFLSMNDLYNFIGILPRSGLMTCSSSNVTVDFSDFPGFEEAMANRERTITVNQRGRVSGRPVYVLSEPFLIDGEFAGRISISVPLETMPNASEELAQLGLRELITLNGNGEILIARANMNTAADELPRDYALPELKGKEGTAFQGFNKNGEWRTYTVVPIEGSPATVVGVWDVEQSTNAGFSNYFGAALFPVLMWFASMAVAMLSIYMLVLRHLARMRRSMDEFATTRSFPDERTSVSMPNELQALSNNFDTMTDDIVREEAALEDTLREKNVLIKEVHHRVKNNLQLISSIMNMQIRTANHTETKQVLARVQDRVLSLATIHRDLYQSQNGGLVDVGALVTEIVEKSVEVAGSMETPADIEIDIDRVWLYPDQAVPLSLMVAEAMTNAMKYLGAAPGARPWIKASLKQSDSECLLILSNSTGTTADAESTGLGAQLINAFTIQLGGKSQTQETDDSFTLSLTFQIEEFEPEVRDF